MTDDDLPIARPRARRWFSWIWLIPCLAAAIVIWLAVRGLEDRGPLITLSFADAEGLQAGETKVRHKDVELGTVESITLTSDMTRVVVRARMRRSASSHLTSGTRFWVVRPRVSIGGISGLSTLVSGAYIEMYPGDGDPQRTFVGLDEPPVLTPDTPGRSYTLQTTDLGSLSGGSQIVYRGLPVGQIEGYALHPDGKQIDVYAFVREPYDRFINPQTRFWNSGGIDVTVGATGVRLRASTWQQLISGGVSFDTPPEALNDTASDAGSQFRLYENEADAQSDPRGTVLIYRATFTGAAGEIGAGTEVQLQGREVGRLRDAQLQYDDASQAFITEATLVIDPRRIALVHPTAADQQDPVQAVRRRIERLVQRGLRARLLSANFLTGTKVVSLDVVPDAAPAHVLEVDGVAQLPTAQAADLTQILSSAQNVLHHLDSATAGPELKHAIAEFDRTLSNLDRITKAAEPQIQPLLSSLRQAAEAAQRTLQSADGMLGTGAANGADLSHLIRELTDAARSLKDLADYLDRHPEAVLRGRKEEK